VEVYLKESLPDTKVEEVLNELEITVSKCFWLNVYIICKQVPGWYSTSRIWTIGFYYFYEVKRQQIVLRKRTRVSCRVAESEPESEVFWWCWSQIPNNTRSRSRIFCPTPTPDIQLDHFLHHTPNLGIPVEIVKFLLKLLLKQRFVAVNHDFHWF